MYFKYKKNRRNKITTSLNGYIRRNAKNNAGKIPIFVIEWKYACRNISIRMGIW